jgi:hypothetical protein
MVRPGLRGPAHPSAAGLCGTPLRQTQVEGVEGSCADASIACGTSLAWRRETLYLAAEDLVFSSLRLKGKKPPAANMLVADYLRVAARKSGVVAPPRTFGFHTFRRPLASVPINMKVDIKTVRQMEIATNYFEIWWPGTELNRRRQPFQGCALPPELPGHLSAGPA